MNFQLRKTGKDDWTFIWFLRVTTMKDLINETYGWDENTQRGYAEESLNGEIVLVEGKPVGVITLSDWGDQLHLVWMAIVPLMQRQGLGTALVSYCQQQAYNRCKALTLQVLQNNPALSLYSRCGLEIYERKGPHKLLMRWQPKAT